MRGLHGRTYLVTGAASGIGRGTTGRLVEAGANVAMVDLDGEGLAAAAASLPDGQVAPVRCDVSDDGEVAAAVAAALDRFGALHGVVTSAGIFDLADFGDLDATDPATFQRVLSVNVTGTFLVLRAALPHLGPGGAVVTVASTAGLRGHGFGAAYTASKGGVVALTRLAALQYGPRGVRVNCVCPGATAGEGMGATFTDPDTAAAVAADLPLRRVGTGADLGSAIAALLSDEMAYVTGQVLAVDGGATAR